MKAILRPQKTQYKTIILYTDPNVITYYWDRRPLMAAGFTDFDILLVGAQGGRAGDAWGQSSGDRAYSSAGGGGGSLRLKGKLKDLPLDVTQFYVGAVGFNGADSGSNEAPAGGGNDGTQSGMINGFVYEAHGGTGGIGADFNFTSTTDFSRVGEGGDGGGNSAGLGSGGLGGRSIKTDPDGNVAGTAPSIGNYAVGSGGGGSLVVGGGHGGGGGPGRVKTGGTTRGPALAGSDGNAGAPTWSTGPGGAAGTNSGGYGGGYNIGDFLPGVPLETADVYGSYIGADGLDTSGHPNGVVCIKVS